MNFAMHKLAKKFNVVQYPFILHMYLYCMTVYAFILQVNFINVYVHPQWNNDRNYDLLICKTEHSKQDSTNLNSIMCFLCSLAFKVDIL